MNIPAVIGVGDEFLSDVKEGDEAIVDGFDAPIFRTLKYIMDTSKNLVLVKKWFLEVPAFLCICINFLFNHIQKQSGNFFGSFTKSALYPFVKKPEQAIREKSALITFCRICAELW